MPGVHQNRLNDFFAAVNAFFIGRLGLNGPTSALENVEKSLCERVTCDSRNSIDNAFSLAATRRKPAMVMPIKAAAGATKKAAAGATKFWSVASIVK